MDKIEILNEIEKLEAAGEIDPSCKTCQEIFYKGIRAGMKYWNIFAPRHKASPRCKSGKYPHCTCDTCF